MLLAEQPGIELDVEDQYGDTPLMWCAYTGLMTGVQALVDAGSNPNYISSSFR